MYRRWPVMHRLPPFTFRDFSFSVGSALKVSTQTQDDTTQGQRFRLVCLDDLTLQPFEIGSSPPYIAISHVWADNLFVDLPHFDSSLGGRAVRTACREKFPAVKYCWVDNFCILQDNESDKFEQIPLMREIYRNADAVLITHACELGLTQDELDEAMSGVEEVVELWRLGTPYHAEQFQCWLDRKGDGYARITRAMKSLAGFAKSDWCTRVWTLQEFIFARTIVWIGADLLPLTCEVTFFVDLPLLCERLYLKELILSGQYSDSRLVRLRHLFVGMATMRLAGNDSTTVMEVAARRDSSIPIDEIYGAMAASGVQIPPLPDDSIEEAWARWCEAAVIQGHIRWLMLPPVAPSVWPDFAQVKTNCMFTPASTRHIASETSALDTVVPYAPPSISAGTVTLAAKFAGRCRLLRRLGPMQQVGETTFPITSLILFSKGDWFIAATIAESLSLGQFSKGQLHAVANVLANNYESTLHWINENKDLADYSIMFSSPSEEIAHVTVSDYLVRAVAPLSRGAIVYLALLEDEELQVSSLVVVALGDREPTGPLVVFDVNAATMDGITTLLVAEAGHEDTQREQQDPDFNMDEFIFHKVGIAISPRVTVDRPFFPIKIGGSLCPVCRSEGE